MSDLAEKIKASRQIVIEVGHMKFFARRLTWLEYARVSSGRVDEFSALTELQLVTGWENVHGKDIDPSGGDELVPFDRQTFDEVIVDMPTAYHAITDKVTRATQEFFKAREENAKNSVAGTTKASGK